MFNKQDILKIREQILLAKIKADIDNIFFGDDYIAYGIYTYFQDYVLETGSEIIPTQRVSNNNLFVEVSWVSSVTGTTHIIGDYYVDTL